MLEFNKLNKNGYCVGIGEVLFDCFADQTTLGGAPANFAYHCSNLSTQALIVSAVGNDRLGQKAILQLQKKGLKLQIKTNEYATGRVDISLDTNGIASYQFLDNCAYDHLVFDEQLKIIAQNSTMVCFGSLAQRSLQSQHSIMAFLKQMPANSLRMFDINLRQNFYTKQIIEQSLQLANAFKCNEDELPVLAQLLKLSSQPQSFYQQLSKQYAIELLIYTQGGATSSVFFKQQCSTLPSKNVEVVDTVGAGDAFTASLLCALLKGFSLAQAHSFAIEVSGYVCTQQGAMPAYPQSLLALLT